MVPFTTSRRLALGLFLAALGGPCGSLMGALLGEPGAAARPGDPPPPVSSPDPVQGRLRPLQMNYFARAHVRGVSGGQASRKALMSEVAHREAPYAQEQSPRSQPPAPWVPSRTVAPGPASAHPSPARPGQARAPAPSPGPRSMAKPAPAARSAPAPRPAPTVPLLRQGAGYPLPPWLSGLRLPDIPIRFSAAVYRYLAYYRTDPVGRAVLSGWLGRMKRFEALIRAELRRHGMPQALLYVAMIESGFRPTTVSRAGAAGLWQFMAHGGSIYGLSRSFWVDERFNPDRSTRAVMYYLQDLHLRFGNWELALAAYNAGYGAILRAVEKYNTNDYHRLSEYEAGLPHETMAYVPKLFAIAVIAENLERFQLTPLRPAAPWDYALVAAPGGMPLSDLAKLAGVPLSTLKELNPELLRNRLPPGPPFEVRVPVGTAGALRASLALRQTGHRKLQPYRVRQGDSLASIAREHRTTVALLKRLNDIRSHRELRPGVTLLVPAPPPGARPAPEDLRVVALPEATPPTPDHRAVYYPVVAGDQLAGVARALGVREGDLLLWNDVSAETRLLPGLVLRAFVPKDRSLPGVRLLDPATLQVVTVNSPEFHAVQLGRQGRRRLLIKARPGDTLTRIAARTGCALGSLARANKLARNAALRPGQTLVVYVNAPKWRPKARPSREAPIARPRREAPNARPRREAPNARPRREAPQARPRRVAPQARPAAGPVAPRPTPARQADARPAPRRSAPPRPGPSPGQP